MRGEWNGLQASFLRECPYAYYVHCFAHKLQLALVAAFREAKSVHQFFENLNFVINIVVGSSKRNDELQSAQVAEIESMIASNEIETGRGANQIGTLQRPGDTRWSSHFDSVCSLIRMFHATCSVLDIISKEGTNYSQRSDAEAAYMSSSRSCRQNEESSMTMEHHFRIDVFITAIDFQLQEIDNRFSEHAVELLRLSAALSPQDAYKSFKINDICSLVKKFYPQDFIEQEKIILRFQLDHYKLDVPKHSDFQNMFTLSELCRGLAISGKSKIYNLIDKLIRLVLTFPVSTATTKRAFFAMKLVKTKLRSRMEDEFLADNLVVYIEKEILKDFMTEVIMDEFYSMKNRQR
ncbi:uncharacterized protein LOC133872676 [Alnus glutinosa]|uniref:uncharacterized protein LOC133872676 n=1 Tax=Alnus glutinosa TaxID=3517 RepID=UPI002D76B648|nr:uncharacterized protein LOC133872676 [Alnus glutinosa]